ncbi:TonB-dependent receptor [uncultured Fibrella sp.]|uniref:TonB-dependent receptor n=1 Tax=uncultured Fibrella sp. TaxID=1284596 RepID=UPI0035CB2EE8
MKLTLRYWAVKLRQYARVGLLVAACISTNSLAFAAILIRGKVTDSNNQPLAGVSIVIKGSTQGTTSDVAGRYALNVPDEKAVVVFSFIGYKSQQVVVGSGEIINIALVDNSESLDEVIVTGVFDKRTKMESSVAISTLNARQLAQLAPTSAADLLRNVPGVYVNNARGEIANTVYSRGISANSIDNSSGYYYVSMQEDGLPLMNVNYGTDNYLRADITTERLEAVRGGTASILGANAPGGIFNYVSKTGGQTFQGEVRLKFGLEGNGRNPYYRTDANFGGPLSKDGSMTYNIGGFYRQSDGARYPGYPSNNGGQLKANILKNYSSGSIKVYAKLLDDRNAQAEFIPTQNWNDPQILSGLSTTDSYNLPAFSMQIPINNTGTATFNSKDKYYNRDKTIGLNWVQELGAGWTFKNDGKYSAKHVTGNAPAVVTPFATDGIIFYALPHLLQTGHLGTYTFTDKVNGQTLGTIGLFPNIINGQFAGFNFIPGEKNNFPGSNIQKNSLFFLPLFYQDTQINEFIDQFSFSKKLEKMTFNVGGFLANSSVDRVGGQEDSGVGVGTLQDQPHLVDISLTGLDGKKYQITDPNGFMDLGRGGITTSSGTKKQLALFLGHNWSITPQLNLDWGLRYETTNIAGSNTPVTRNPKENDPTWGGKDGNPLTVYDNGGGLVGTPLAFDKTMKTLSFSAGLNYRISNDMAIYVRYSNGNKAPEIGNFFSATDANLIAALNTEAQNIQQLEAALKVKKSRFNLNVTPFFSSLSNVPNLQFAFTDATGNNYNPPIQYAAYQTFGVEIEGNYTFTRNLSLRAHATIQRSKATSYKTWIASDKGQAFDQLLDFSGNETDNNAKLMFGLTPNYTAGKFNAQLNYTYLGSRQANIPNAFQLPAFGQADLSLGYSVSPRLHLQGNINNLLNTYGVLGWSGPGGFPAALNRQGFTKDFVAANPSAVYATQGSMPRAYFLTASYKF